MDCRIQRKQLTVAINRFWKVKNNIKRKRIATLPKNVYHWFDFILVTALTVILEKIKYFQIFVLKLDNKYFFLFHDSPYSVCSLSVKQMFDEK